MKVFKKVLILTVAILSLSSSVAFGACKTAQSASTGVGTDKTVPGQSADGDSGKPVIDSGDAGSKG
jgi:hypothetical protein